MFSSHKEMDFFCAWYYRAQLDENYDSERQFFYFYALFDHLFKTYALEHKEELQYRGLKIDNGEKNKMKFFIYETLCVDKNQNFNTFNPLATLKSGNKTKIIEKLQIKTENDLLQKYELPHFQTISLLFDEIYDIRCNLFHGQADLSDRNNNLLIDEANIVLKDFLSRLFEKKLSEVR